MGFVTFGRSSLVVEAVTVRQYVTFVIGITTVYTIGWITTIADIDTIGWIITVAAVCNCSVSR